MMMINDICGAYMPVTVMTAELPAAATLFNKSIIMTVDGNFSQMFKMLLMMLMMMIE